MSLILIFPLFNYPSTTTPIPCTWYIFWINIKTSVSSLFFKLLSSELFIASLAADGSLITLLIAEFGDGESLEGIKFNNCLSKSKLYPVLFDIAIIGTMILLDTLDLILIMSSSEVTF